MAQYSEKRLIDFHGHYFEEAWLASPGASGQSLARRQPLLTDLPAQLALLDEAGIDTKVISAPVGLLTASGQPMPPALMSRINDRLAELVAVHAGRLLALATIDIFQGELAAREAERVLQMPEIGGLCVDCARGDRFLDAQETRPTLEVAATLGVPVFVHPVYPPGLTERLARLGHTGILLARGTEDAASLLALMRSGLLDALPNLRIVFPMIGAAILLFAGLADLEYERESDWKGTRPTRARTRFYVDTMGFDPAALRFAVELLGPEHVLLGSDWPIMPLTPRRKIEETLALLPLTPEQRALIMGGNTARLFTRA